MKGHELLNATTAKRMPPLSSEYVIEVTKTLLLMAENGKGHYPISKSIAKTSTLRQAIDRELVGMGLGDRWHVKVCCGPTTDPRPTEYWLEPGPSAEAKRAGVMTIKPDDINPPSEAIASEAIVRRLDQITDLLRQLVEVWR